MEDIVRKVRVRATNVWSWRGSEFVKSSRGDETSFELFLAAVGVREARLQQLAFGLAAEK
jgi:hypothetical protein